MSALEKIQYAVTSITIEFQNINPIPVGSYIEIINNEYIWIYPVDENNVQCFSNLVSVISCEFPRDKIIQFRDLFET